MATCVWMLAKGWARQRIADRSRIASTTVANFAAALCIISSGTPVPAFSSTKDIGSSLTPPEE